VVNGHAHSLALPYLEVGQYHSIGLPVPFSDVVVGAQTITLSAQTLMMVTNVNLVLLAAAPVPGVVADPTATPTPTGVVTATATTTATPTAVATSTATVLPTSTPAAQNCTVLASLNGTPTTYTRPLVYCSDQ
jgi:hypothetical protein